jgi:hypothetical protein
VNANIEGMSFTTVLTTGSDVGEQTENEATDIVVPKDSIWENHFEDNEKLTTVTIIEDFDQVGLETIDPKPQQPSPPIEQVKVFPSSTTIIPDKIPSRLEKEESFPLWYKSRTSIRSQKSKSQKTISLHTKTEINDTLESIIFLYQCLELTFCNSKAGILFPLVLVSISASLLHSASNRKKIHIHRRITSRVSMKNIPPSSSLTWCKWGESLMLHVILGSDWNKSDYRRRKLRAMAV